MANAANTLASTLEKCKALLQEVVPELNSSSSNSEASTSTPAVTGTGSGLQLSDSIHNEHRRLFGFQYRGGYNLFSRRSTALKASRAKRQPTWTRTFVSLPNKFYSLSPSCAAYTSLKKAGLGDRKITLNLDQGGLEGLPIMLCV